MNLKVNIFTGLFWENLEGKQEMSFSVDVLCGGIREVSKYS